MSPQSVLDAQNFHDAFVKRLKIVLTTSMSGPSSSCVGWFGSYWKAL